jgi:hypothetical protein
LHPAEALHHVGHGAVLLLGHLLQDFNHVAIGIVPPSLLEQLLLAAREVDIMQGLCDIGDRAADSFSPPKLDTNKHASGRSGRADGPHPRGRGSFHRADAFHHVGHCLVLLVGHLAQNVQNIVLGLIGLGLPNQILLVAGEVDVFQMMGDVRWRMPADSNRHTYLLESSCPLLGTFAP